MANRELQSSARLKQEQINLYQAQVKFSDPSLHNNNNNGLVTSERELSNTNNHKKDSNGSNKTRNRYIHGRVGGLLERQREKGGNQAIKHEPGRTGQGDNGYLRSPKLLLADHNIVQGDERESEVERLAARELQAHEQRMLDSHQVGPQGEIRAYIQRAIFEGQRVILRGYIYIYSEGYLEGVIRVMTKEDAGLKTGHWASISLYLSILYIYMSFLSPFFGNPNKPDTNPDIPDNPDNNPDD